MLQVASHALGIDACKIHISETSTQCVPNTSPTAASCGSDLNGMAIMVSFHSIQFYSTLASCKIHISDTSPQFVSKTSPSAACHGSDLNGMAINGKFSL